MDRRPCLLALLALLTAGLTHAADGIPTPLFPPDPWERASSQLVPTPLFPPDPWERIPTPLFPPDPWE